MKTPKFLFLAFALLTLINCNAHHSQNSFNSENSDIYKITILNENEGFNTAIKTTSINKQINSAIMVSSTSRWVNIKTSGYDKWFRDSWNEDAWWEKTNQWDDFSYKTGEDGVINLKIGIYTRNDAGEYGPLLPGVSIYVAVNK